MVPVVTLQRENLVGIKFAAKTPCFTDFQLGNSYTCGSRGLGF